MTWVLLCDDCFPRDRGAMTVDIHITGRECASCTKPIPMGEGNPWRTQDEPITPSSGNATD